MSVEERGGRGQWKWIVHDQRAESCGGKKWVSFCRVDGLRFDPGSKNDFNGSPWEGVCIHQRGEESLGEGGGSGAD